MMLKRFSFITILLLIQFSAKAQEPVPGDFRQNFNQGNLLVAEENYSEALRYFQEAYRTDSSGANINFKVGLCILKVGLNKKTSLTYLSRAVRDVTRNYDEYDYRQKKAPEMSYYFAAQAYHLNYEFDSAEVYFNKYKAIIGTRNATLAAEIENRLRWCAQAKILVTSPLPLALTLLPDSVNSELDEYSPVFSLDENTIYFTSKREGPRTPDGDFYEDIFVSERKPDSTWSTPRVVPSIQTPTNEASISLSADGQTLFIYKDENGGDIYASVSDGKDWSQPVPLGSDINTKYWEPHACLSADGQTLYFVSDRPGGFGGRDLYRCVKLPNGRWSKALNMGPQVNTAFNEDAPFIHPDQTTLFFASEGHSSMGGFDIFFTVKDDEGNWSTPTNAGYPINTTDDDVFFITSVDGKRGYFSATRPDGKGGKDLYLANLEQPKSQPLTLLKGRIYNIDGSPLTQFVEINVTNTQTSELEGTYRPNSRTGTFMVILPPGATYLISYVVDGQEYSNEIIDVPMGSEFEVIDRGVDLRDLVLGKLNPDLPIDKTKIPKTQPNIPGDTLNPVAVRPKRNVRDVKGELTSTRNMSFEMFFKYNISEIDPQDQDFQKFIDTCVAHINKYGNIRFRITAAASQVPTRKFPTNKALAEDRAAKAQAVINNALEARGVDMTKVKWVKVNAMVLGPTYRSDFVKNRETYEKYQYVRVRGY